MTHTRTLLFSTAARVALCLSLFGSAAAKGRNTAAAEADLVVNLPDAPQVGAGPTVRFFKKKLDAGFFF